MQRSCKNCKCKRKFKHKYDPTASLSSISVPKENYIMNNGFKMLKSFAMSMASRGLKNKKVDIPVKKLRVLSCFGDQEYGGQLPPCEHLAESKTEGKSYCSGCGCGDKKRTWLLAEGDEYSKLDHPKLTCPLKMPGFTDYVTEDDGVAERMQPNNRKYIIENYSYISLNRISVTSPGAPPEVEQENE